MAGNKRVEQGHLRDFASLVAFAQARGSPFPEVRALRVIEGRQRRAEKLAKSAKHLRGRRF